MAFVGISSQIKLLFDPLVIQLVWYILKQLFTSVSVKVVDFYLHLGEYLLTAINYCTDHFNSPINVIKTINVILTINVIAFNHKCNKSTDHKCNKICS